MLKIIPDVSPRSLNNQSFLQKAAKKAGAFIPQKLSQTFEMTNKGSFDRIPLFLIAMVFVLGARFYKSRDSHERREVLTRDGITVGSTFFAVPVIKNWISKGLDKISKIPTASADSEFFSLKDYSLENLRNLYSKADKMPEKAYTMAQNIVDRGGDVLKAFSKLGKESIENLKIISGDNLSSDNLLKSLKQATTTKDENIKNAFEALTKALSPVDNALVQSAQKLKAIPNLASIILATMFLGWGIPAFNIHFTRKKLKHNHKNTDSINLEPQLTENQRQIISTFLNKI